MALLSDKETGVVVGEIRKGGPLMLHQPTHHIDFRFCKPFTSGFGHNVPAWADSGRVWLDRVCFRRPG